MNIRLVKLTEEYKGQLVEMMDEWTNANEKIGHMLLGKMATIILMNI